MTDHQYPAYRETVIHLKEGDTNSHLAVEKLLFGSLAARPCNMGAANHEKGNAEGEMHPRSYLYKDLGFGAIAIRSPYISPDIGREFSLPKSDDILMTLDFTPFRRRSPRNRRSARENAMGSAHYHPRAIQDWFSKRESRTGIRLDSELFAMRIIKGIQTTREGRKLPFPFISITCRARILDRSAFRLACLSGIGRARAYGMGMILATDAE